MRKAMASSQRQTTPLKNMMLKKKKEHDVNQKYHAACETKYTLQALTLLNCHAHFYLLINPTTGTKNFLVRYGGRYRVQAQIVSKEIF